MDAQNNPSSEETLPDDLMTLSLSDIPNVSLRTDKKDDKFYVGEDATIRAKCRSSLNVLRVKWQRNTANGFRDIDTTLPKYKETRNETACYYQLEITILNCNKSDGGTYILKLTCQNVAFSSGEIDLNVVEGSPEVDLQKVPLVDLNTRVELKATIRGFPRYHSVIWKKDEKNIDTTNPKYVTSEDSNKNYAVLCIKSVKKEDGGKYTIEVQNQLGKGQSSQKLDIKGGKYI